MINSGIQSSDLSAMNSFFLLSPPNEESTSRTASNIQKAIDVASILNRHQETGTLKTNPFIREPLENIQKKDGLINPEEKFSNFISFERFRSVLRRTFSETLNKIRNAQEKDYVIIGNSAEKSQNWVISQTLDLMDVHPPKAIIAREYLTTYLENNRHVKHVVLMDDAAYSGTQVKHHISELTGLENRIFYINIPFMTSFAKEKIENTLKNLTKHYYFPATRQVMLTYQQLYRFGFFGYVKMNRPDVKKFLEMPSIEMNSNLIGEVHHEQIKKVESCQRQFEELKKTIFKKKDESIRDLLDQLIQEIEKISPFIKESQKIVENLKSVKKGVERFGVDPQKSEAEKERYFLIKSEPDKNRIPKNKNEPDKEEDLFRNKSLFNSRTGTWMAHKAAGGISVGRSSTMNAMKFPQNKISEPYKNDPKRYEERENQIKRLQSEFPEIVKQWETCTVDLSLSHITIVQSNRGVFLLGNNYIGKTLDGPVINIITDKDTIPLGNLPDNYSAFQFKVEEGISFTIASEKGDKIAQFEYTKNENGILEIKRLKMEG